MSFFPFLLDFTPRRFAREPYHHVSGNLAFDFDFSSALIVQLNNCVARKVHRNSLTWDLTKKYHYADPYQHRLSGPYPNLASEPFRAKPGSIELLHPPPGQEGPSFCCLYGQYKMGRSSSTYYLNCPKIGTRYRFMALRMDSYEHRLHYFHKCLRKLLLFLSSSDKFEYVAIPFHIGCGLAGGKWSDYEPMISQFCKRLKKVKPSIKVLIVDKI